MNSAYFKTPSSEFVYVRTYSHWKEDLKRREKWDETVDRYISFIQSERGDIIPPKILARIREKILNLEVVPSMRGLWAAGPAAKATNVTMYNCAALAVDSIEAFSETLYVLCCGAGIGFSVQKEYINKLPEIPVIGFNKNGVYIVPDSKEGWADSVKYQITCLYEGKDTEFDYSLIRPAGAKLKTMGGRASGSEPLAVLHKFIKDTFFNAQGRKLTSLECHDILSQTAEIVCVGGVRRASEISLSDLDDLEMRNAKKWPFPVKRMMANNSAVYLEKASAIDFLHEWSSLASSRTGERGIFNLYAARKNGPERRDMSKVSLTNPCLVGETIVEIVYKGIIQFIETKTLLELVKYIDKEVILIRSYNESTREFEFKKIIEVFLTKSEAKIIEVTDSISGKSIRCTPDHRILTERGYVPAEELKEDDILIIKT